MSDSFVLGRAPGPVARVRARGAVVAGLEVTDHEGRRRQIVPDPDSALASVYVGASIGRYANRIRGGTFTLDGVEHQLAPNDHGNNLHGGPDGFDVREWQVRSSSADHVELTLVSPDGDQGFPGEVSASARFSVADGALETTYSATTTAPTPLSLTSHLYVSLGGATVHDHVLQVAASRFLPTDEHSMPGSDARDLEGSPLDLRSGARLGDVLAGEDDQVAATGGIDHCYLLDGPARFREVAVLTAGGLRLRMATDQAALQVYTGQALPTAYAAVALEPQHPLQDLQVLRPGATYRWRSRVSVESVAG